MADLLISVWALYLLYIMGAAGGNFCILIFNILKYKIGDRFGVFPRKNPPPVEVSFAKKHYEFCPADACPAESQISRGGGRRNAEPDVQYGRPYLEVEQCLQWDTSPFSQWSSPSSLHRALRTDPDVSVTRSLEDRPESGASSPIKQSSRKARVVCASNAMPRFRGRS